ncbi:MAG TPA: glutaredoxin domain-containing protein [Candidatus Limnocylindrales bacterium]|nr:glutaredoxin domain-containing protein [Candidatus Limnocylindrales bacterium]
MSSYPEILILGRDTCEDTIASRAHLDKLGIPYVYRNVEIDTDADVWNRSYNDGNRVTPVILIGDPQHPTAVLIEPSDALLEQAVTGS